MSIYYGSHDDDSDEPIPRSTTTHTRFRVIGWTQRYGACIDEWFRTRADAIARASRCVGPRGYDMSWVFDAMANARTPKHPGGIFVRDCEGSGAA